MSTSYLTDINILSCIKGKEQKKMVTIKTKLRLTGIQNISQKLTSTLLR